MVTPVRHSLWALLVAAVCLTPPLRAQSDAPLDGPSEEPLSQVDSIPEQLAAEAVDNTGADNADAGAAATTVVPDSRVVPVRADEPAARFVLGAPLQPVTLARQETVEAIDPSPGIGPHPVAPEGSFTESIVSDGTYGNGTYEIGPGGGEYEGLLPTLKSSGTWLHRGRWFLQSDFVMLHRTPAPGQPLTGSLGVDFRGIPVRNEVMSADSCGFGYEPGMRISLSRYRCRDEKNRDHTWEFTYQGMFDWETDYGVNADGTRFQLVAIPDDSAGNGFNATLRHTMAYSSDRQDFELNYRIDHRLGRDRLVLDPCGEWQRECSSGLTPSLLAGFRVVSIDEDFNWSAFGRANVVDPNPNERRANYDIRANNDLVGVQLGGGLVHQSCNWSLGVRTKLGGLVNFADQRSRHFFLNTNNVATERVTQASDRQLAFLWDLSITGAYQLRPNVALRLGYDLSYLHGLALAPQQIDFNDANLPRAVTTGDILYDGGWIGIEWNR